ncbi:hypothetical protein RhiJN_13156 [Ceratobasidium sp. AG-Ba]|nr:hypothetical protein RhiJN_13156 [Ceratobasidium sp. AG-Ba]
MAIKRTDSPLTQPEYTMAVDKHKSEEWLAEANAMPYVTVYYDYQVDVHNGCEEYEQFWTKREGDFIIAQIFSEQTQEWKLAFKLQFRNFDSCTSTLGGICDKDQD